MNDKEFLQRLHNLPFETLESEKGLGTVLIQNVKDFISSERMTQLLATSAQLEKKAKSVSLAHNPAAADTGVSCAITGSFEIPRSHIKEILQQNGIKVPTSLSKKTTYVLVGSEPGSTAHKAQKLGIPVCNSISALQAILLENHTITISFDNTSERSETYKTQKENVQTTDQEINAHPLF